MVVVCDKSGCLNIYFERTDDKINAHMWQVLISKLCFEQARTQGDIFLHTIKHENERTGWTDTQRQNYLEKINIFHTSATSTHIIENGPLALYVVRQNKKIRLSRLFAETEMSKTAKLKADAEKDQTNDYCEYYNYYCEQLKLFSCIAKCVISPCISPYVSFYHTNTHTHTHTHTCFSVAATTSPLTISSDCCRLTSCCPA